MICRFDGGVTIDRQCLTATCDRVFVFK